MKHESPWECQGPGRRSRPAGEGSGLSQLRQKDRTKKGATTGVDRDSSDIEGGERGANGRGERLQKG